MLTDQELRALWAGVCAAAPREGTPRERRAYLNGARDALTDVYQQYVGESEGFWVELTDALNHGISPNEIAALEIEAGFDQAFDDGEGDR